MLKAVGVKARKTFVKLRNSWRLLLLGMQISYQQGRPSGSVNDIWQASQKLVADLEERATCPECKMLNEPKDPSIVRYQCSECGHPWLAL